MDKKINDFIKLFEACYGRPLRILEAEGLSLESLNKKNFFYSKDSQEVFFPIWDRQKEILSWSVVSSVKDEDQTLFSDMLSFLDGTLMEYIRLKRHFEKLQEKEKIQHLFHDEKIIPWRSRPEKSRGWELPQTSSPDPDLSPLWIRGSSEEILKMVSHLHGESKNWALLSAQENPELIWEDVHSWKDFSRVTLWIPRIEELEDEKIKKLEKNLKALKNGGLKRPLVIVTSGRLPPLPPPLNEKKFLGLRTLFRFGSVHRELEVQVQAHHLLFGGGNHGDWSYYCSQTGELFFLPMSPQPQKWH